MLQSQKLKVEMSKSRERLAALAGKEDLTDDDKNEMRQLNEGYKDLEQRYQAAVISEDREPPTPDAEGVEIDRLEERAALSNYLAAAAQDLPLEGAEKELNEARKIPVQGAEMRQFPLSLLAPAAGEIPAGRKVEARADAVTNVAGDLGVRPQPWLTRLFANQVSSEFATRRAVPPGVAALPFLKNGSDGDHAAKGAAVDAAAASIDVTEQKPRRAQTRYVFAVEDAARWGPMLEDMLVRDARAALVNRMELGLIAGDAPLTGLGDELTRLLDDNSTADAAQATQTTAVKFLDLVLKNIDGIYASMASDFTLVGPPQLAEYVEDLKIEITTGQQNEVLRRRLQDLGVMVRLTSHISAITGNQYPVYFVRSKGVMGRPAAVHSVWESGMLIRDPYSGSSKGEIAVTVCALHDFDVVDTSAILARRVTLS